MLAGGSSGMAPVSAEPGPPHPGPLLWASPSSPLPAPRQWKADFFHAVFVSLSEREGLSTAKLIYTMDFLLGVELPCSPLGDKFMSPKHTDLLTLVMLVALADPRSPSLGGNQQT